jgi:hypothetical protein
MQSSQIEIIFQPKKYKNNKVEEMQEILQYLDRM